MLRPQTSNLNTIKKISFLKIFGVVAFLFFFGFATQAHALTISPARIEINGNPGAMVGGEFTLINEQSTSQTFYSSFENFSAQGETGAPAFSAEQTGLDSWLAVSPTQVTIAPGQAVKVPYTISIPKGTEPGGYFAAIFWSSTPPSTATTQVSIGAKVGVLILLTVNGKISEQAGITTFDKDGHGFFYTTLPVTLRYKFHNGGGDRVEPVGTMTIRDTIFLPATRFDANPAVGNILPNSTRQFTLDWIKQASPVPVTGFFNAIGYEWQNFAIGLYSAHLNLAYGTHGLHATKTAWFFVLPWQLLICIIIVISFVWWIGKGIITRYNRYIIRMAQSTMPPRDADHS